MAENPDWDGEFEVVPVDSVPIADILAVLDETFGLGPDEAWFAWKHVENPHGRSLGWVAVDSEGVAGVRLFMRWTLENDGEQLEAVRPVDTATAKRARKRGVFRHLTTFAIEQVKKDPRIHLIFNTPNENSQPGYARMGWTMLPPIGRGIRLLLPGAAAEIENDDGVFRAFDDAAPKTDRLSTRRDRTVLDWRYGERAPVAYGRARLRRGEAPNGIIYRTVTRTGFRWLLVHELAGTPAERRLLARSAARGEGAVGIVVAAGPGALPLLTGPCIRRSGKIVAVRPLRPCQPDPTSRDNWALTLGDLEGVI